MDTMNNEALHAALTATAAANIRSYEDRRNSDRVIKWTYEAKVTITAAGRVRIHVPTSWFHKNKNALAQLKAIKLDLLEALPEGATVMRETKNKSAIFRTGFYNLGAFNTTGFYSTYYVKA